ncbi:putative Noranthrone monooxygenase [Seiridium cardinale]|uniref:Noranthrone monooxygenase n=1 Tax=Seiridium cardinale TaxID=138064 RepID=A0ABR2X820_9PEZI
MGSILSDLDPTKLPLTGGILGILSTHLFYSMNTTINYLTIPTVFLGQPPKDHSQPASPAFLVASTGTAASPASHLNRQWQEIYWRGHRVGPASAILVGSHLAPRPIPVKSRTMDGCSHLAPPTALTAWPYTLIAMVPTNDELHRRGDAVTEGVGRKKACDERETAAFLAKWVRLSKVRANLGLVATILGVAALLL